MSPCNQIKKEGKGKRLQKAVETLSNFLDNGKFSFKKKKRSF